MKIKISGKNMEVSQYLRDTVDKKASKMERYFKPETEMHVTLSIQKARNIAEITLAMDGVVLRAEEATGDMYSSIEVALRKLERQIRKHRTKLEKRLHEQAYVQDVVFDQGGTDFADEEEPQIVKTKKFAVRPMEVEDASIQMEMLGHDFFVYRNPHTSEINIMYKRADGDLGVIEPL